ncbi:MULTISPECIES: NADH-quinone oxidoreductase subunit D [unclassified Streptomyces]|uniref:NADH-quinone oxidoreductase subunit D n=1 Tax=unclassified Streptomyces TaxID=2593676 RepID=UPI000DC7A143|nr:MULTISPECIES: NADH-quinone oxidoreductase subunit D [unclassified Streptomyces]AWZ05744.1 NADH-quinone oxidoreductase subunit D [Streptomyces sp. ICC4]AWZ14418.1 NADH-quinone oxidoreductase subunit D [Streptomyces sp. ICC1]
MTETTVGIGGAAESTDMVLNIGPQHPSTHGVLRLRLVLDGERIVSAEPVVGYMHRGAEKLFEARDYRQIVMLANRHDWLSAFSNELGVVMAVERMLGMEVPERAVWMRTLLAELNRVLNHLMFLGSYPLELGGITPIFHAFREREELQAVMEEISGGRMHYMFNRVGGLKEDLPAGWLGRAREAIADVRTRMHVYDDLVRGNEIFRARTRGVGVLSAEAVHAYGVSGPIARASGVDFDLRRDEPYLAYGDLQDVLKVVTRTEGDCLARFEVLLEQTHNALDLAVACLDRMAQLAPGPINQRLPKVLKAPEGETYAWTENPLGINGYYLVSKGEKTPYRLKLRSASYNNIQALAVLLPGQLVADMVSILGSLFFVVGDIDK